MELFTRDMILAGPPGEVRQWVADIATAYGNVTGKTPTVWTSIAGGMGGHYTWSMEVDGSAEIVDHSMQALADPTYLAAIEAGRKFFTGAPHDTIYRSFMPVPELERGPGSVAAVTTATASAGSLGHAVGWGIELAEYVSRTTEIPTVLMSTVAGAYSRLTWIGMADDARAADEADRALKRDDEYLKLIARGGSFFASGTARTQMFIRIA